MALSSVRLPRCLRGNQSEWLWRGTRRRGQKWSRWGCRPSLGSTGLTKGLICGKERDYFFLGSQRHTSCCQVCHLFCEAFLATSRTHLAVAVHPLCLRFTLFRISRTALGTLRDFTGLKIPLPTGHDLGGNNDHRVLTFTPTVASWYPVWPSPFPMKCS